MKNVKLTPSAFRNGVKWLGLLLIFHVAALILFSIFLAPDLKVRYDYEEYTAAYTTVLVFDLVCWLVVAFIWVLRGQMSHDEVRRKIVEARKEEGFSPLSYFARTFLVDWTWRSAFFFVLQIPFTVFFANYGLALNDTMFILEKFYIAEAGFYATTGSAILGLLLSTLYFFAVMVLMTLIKYLHLVKKG